MPPDASTIVAEDRAPLARPLAGRRSPGIARAAAYAVLGASADALPLPFVSDALVERVRGALLHEFAAARGVSLTPEARTILAGPSEREQAVGIGQKAATFVGVRLVFRVLRRLGPIWAVWPVRQAARTLLLAHLFDRYLDVVRQERAVRIDVEEARRVRRAVDGALGRAFAMQTPTEATENGGVDDQRDRWTVLVDGLLGATAGLPDRALRRLEAAFDDLLVRADG